MLAKRRIAGAFGISLDKNVGIPYRSFELVPLLEAEGAMGEMVVAGAFLLLWFGLAALGAAMNFTHNMFSYPTIAKQHYDAGARHFWFNVVGGPVAFLTYIFDKRVRAVVREHGLWTPSASARAKADEITESAHRKIIEESLRGFDAPEDQKERLREAFLLLKDRPQRNQSAVLEALFQKPPEGPHKLH